MRLLFSQHQIVRLLAAFVLSGLFHSVSLAGDLETPAEQQRVAHLARLGASRWHVAGHRGKGVKIAVLDTGFRGWRDHLGKALPAHVSVRSFRADGNLEARDSQHGILCAEVIHAIAPETELLFANWETTQPEQFLAAVRWAREEGARVVSCSVVMPSFSDGEGGGAVHRELATLLGSGAQPADLLCFASAGNTTDRHWSGTFRDHGDGFHTWQGGQIDNGLRPWSSERVSVEVYGRPGPSVYELSVHEADSEREVGRARTDPRQVDRMSAAVRFDPQPGVRYRVRLRLVQGPGDVLHVATMWASLSQTTSRASVCFPADGTGVVALGAVDQEGHKHWYSACGPNSERPKPDLVATVPFPSLWRERPFGGTSAAAPQAAAVAALWWSRHLDWTADQVRAAVRSAANDLGPKGHDGETGYGLICLPPE